MKDKVLLKVAGIFAMICGGIYCLTIIGIIIGIPLLIGGSRMIDFSKMEDQKLENYKTQLLVWGIIFLIFTTISGVLVLIYYIAGYFDFNGNKMSYLDEIEKLKKLYDDGAITEEEYEKKKNEILRRESK